MKNYNNLNAMQENMDMRNVENRTYALMALASFGRRCSSFFAKLSTKVSTAPLNSSR